VPRTVPSLRLYRVRSHVLQLRAEGVFVEPDGRGVAGVVVDGEDVEATRAIRNVAFGEETQGYPTLLDLFFYFADAVFQGADGEVGLFFVDY
jgi:hypothetical protein